MIFFNLFGPFCKTSWWKESFRGFRRLLLHREVQFLGRRGRCLLVARQTNLPDPLRDLGRETLHMGVWWCLWWEQRSIHALPNLLSIWFAVIHWTLYSSSCLDGDHSGTYMDDTKDFGTQAGACARWSISLKHKPAPLHSSWKPGG